MGEARRKKERGPSDEAKLTTTQSNPEERGLIICNPVQLQGNAVLLKSNKLDPHELRFSLLFWDKLVWPRNRVFDLGGGSDADYLEGAGIISRPLPNPLSGNASDSVLDAQVSAFYELDKIQPGQWAIAQGDDSLSIHPHVKQYADSQSALIELHRAIPIPDYDVPIAEILEFKLRRRDELLLLRQRFEQLTKEIGASAEPMVVLREKLAEIDQACANLLELGREWRWPVKLGSMNATVEIKPADMGLNGFEAFQKAESLGLGLEAAGIVAGATALLSAITYKPSGFSLQGVRCPKHPYRYASSISRDL